MSRHCSLKILRGRGKKDEVEANEEEEEDT
jgi:hypothetical protein